MRTALFWDVTQQGVVIPYLRFGAIYRSRLQGSRTGTFIRDPAFRYSAWDSDFCHHTLCLKQSVQSTFVAPVIVDVFEMYKKVWWCVHGTSLPLQHRPDKQEAHWSLLYTSYCYNVDGDRII